jgi:glycerol-3-phosphate acyltransferase PlsY
MTPILITIIVSYLMGSIPFGYLLVRWFRGEDVRGTGSGNIGATNVARSSPALGVATLLLDALKGALAVEITIRLFPPKDFMTALLPYVAALMAVVGHIFPVWLHFRGGKGVATGLGSFLMLAPKAMVLTLGVFVIVVLAWRIVSLASVFAVAAFPLLAWLVAGGQSTPQMLGLMSAASLLVIVKHHQNIGRLLAGTESRIGAKRG